MDGERGVGSALERSASPPSHRDSYCVCVCVCVCEGGGEHNLIPEC